MEEIKLNPFKRQLKFLYFKLAQINDTPQKIALGLALGVFLGFMPGTGPIAAITLAVFLRINRLAALIGSLLTNTWISVVTLMPAIKIGSSILNLKYSEIYRDWAEFLETFRWSSFLKASVYKIIFPVFLGYLIIGLLIAILVYLACLLMLKAKKIRK